MKLERFMKFWPGLQILNLAFNVAMLSAYAWHHKPVMVGVWVVILCMNFWVYIVGRLREARHLGTMETFKMLSKESERVFGAAEKKEAPQA